MHTPSSLRVGVAFALALGALAGCNDADEDNELAPITGEVPAGVFRTKLTRLDVVPFCEESSVFALGSADVLVSLDEQVITLDHLTFQGTSTPVTRAHVHLGAPGENGPLLFVIAVDPVSPVTTVVFTEGDYRAPAGAPPTFAGVVEALFLGGIYIDLHTVRCPRGELRGQLRPLLEAF